jgi:fermentation-respiration switch protein FrsA (DUF1100 family)
MMRLCKDLLGPKNNVPDGSFSPLEWYAKLNIKEQTSLPDFNYQGDDPVLKLVYNTETEKEQGMKYNGGFLVVAPHIHGKYVEGNELKVFVTTYSSTYNLYDKLVTASSGGVIPAAITYIKNAETTENTVILVHGIGGDRWSMMTYGDLYLDKGFNILIYDTRNHAQSGGGDVSYGYYEKDDLNSVVQYVKKLNPNGIIGIEGVSMGAATTVLYADKYSANKDVSFYVADCPYSDLYSLFKVRLQEDYHLPNLMLIQYASLVSKIRSGFFFGQVSPIIGIDKVTAPMLIIHGKADTYVPTDMGVDLYNKKNDNKQLFLVENAAHAKSINVDRQGYKDNLYKFIDEAIKK